MVVEIKSSAREYLSKFFESYQYQRVFIDGSIDGQFGKVWADSEQNPKVALINHALTYLGGDAKHPAAKEILSKAVTTSESLFLPTKEWEELFEKSICG